MNSDKRRGKNAYVSSVEVNLIVEEGDGKNQVPRLNAMDSLKYPMQVSKIL